MREGIPIIGLFTVGADLCVRPAPVDVRGLFLVIIPAFVRMAAARQFPMRAGGFPFFRVLVRAIGRTRRSAPTKPSYPHCCKGGVAPLTKAFSTAPHRSRLICAPANAVLLPSY